MTLIEVLAAYADTMRRPLTDRENTVGASEIGQCARKVFYSKRAGERDPDFTDTGGAALRGHIFERHFWTRALRARFRRKLLFAGKGQQTFTSGFLSATPDGLLIN